MWPIIEAYLSGAEPFDAAADRLADLLRAWERQEDTPSPPGESVRGRMLLIPFESVPEEDQPRVSSLVRRAFELADTI